MIVFPVQVRVGSLSIPPLIFPQSQHAESVVPVMKQSRPCPECLTWSAWAKAFAQFGMIAIDQPDPKQCRICHGSGRIEVDIPLPKRRKDWSGDEWLEEDRKWDWEQYLASRPIDSGWTN